jgi:hypothetical protein
MRGPPELSESHAVRPGFPPLRSVQPRPPDLPAQIEHGGGSRLAFTPDGERIVVAHDDTTALVWEWKRFLVADD